MSTASKRRRTAHIIPVAGRQENEQTRTSILSLNYLHNELSMTAVLGQQLSSSSKKRQVGFADCINWEEENRRSCRGSESRRRKREKRKMLAEQRREQMHSCLEIIADAEHEDRIVQLCSRTRGVRGTILGEDADRAEDRQGDENEGSQLRRLLANFRRAGKDTLARLNNQEETCIGDLLGLSGFYEEFKDFIPPTVISSEENTPEREGQLARPQARRDTVQQERNVDRHIDRNLGVPQPPVVARHRVDDDN